MQCFSILSKRRTVSLGFGMAIPNAIQLTEITALLNFLQFQDPDLRESYATLLMAMDEEFLLVMDVMSGKQSFTNGTEQGRE